MEERAAELETGGHGGAKKADEAQACLDKIAEMSEPGPRDRRADPRLVTREAPQLDYKTWYGAGLRPQRESLLLLPVHREKFGARYATFGFQDVATLDDGNVWPASFAATKLTKVDEKMRAELVRRAVGG